MPTATARATDHRWAIILAGGCGTRLAELTTDAAGRVVPKQYCSLLGGRSLLGDAVARAERLVDPGRIVTVVAREHEPYWRLERRAGAFGEVLVQPRDRGTAVGLLLPLMWIAARDPQAEVVVLPSDHFVAAEPALSGALRLAQAAAHQGTSGLVLVGITPERPEPDYGWILPAEVVGSVRRVARFVEKPGAVAAAALMRAGALWNSLLMVGTLPTFWRLYGQRLPELLAAFRAVTVADHLQLDRLYSALPDADFSRHLLQGGESDLRLSSAPHCGWTDLGTPGRLQSCLAALGVAARRGCRPGTLAAAAGAAGLLGAAPGRTGREEPLPDGSALDFTEGGAILPAPGYPVV